MDIVQTIASFLGRNRRADVALWRDIHNLSQTCRRFNAILTPQRDQLRQRIILEREQQRLQRERDERSRERDLDRLYSVRGQPRLR